MSCVRACGYKHLVIHCVQWFVRAAECGVFTTVPINTESAIPLTVWQDFRAPPESQLSVHLNYHISTYGSLRRKVRWILSQKLWLAMRIHRCRRQYKVVTFCYRTLIFRQKNKCWWGQRFVGASSTPALGVILLPIQWIQGVKPAGALGLWGLKVTS